MSVVNLGPIVFLLPFFSWELNLGNKCPVPISLLFICVLCKKDNVFLWTFKNSSHQGWKFFLFFCIFTSTADARVSWLIQWSLPFELKIKKNRQSFFFKYLISATFTTFINFPKWRTRWSLLVKEKKVLTWTVIFCLTDKEVSVIRPRSKLFANWYHRLLALISWSRKIVAPVINGLSDTINRIINIAPCLRHWIGIESVIDIPSFLVVISQCKWNKIITACKKRPKQPYQVCVLSSKYIRDW